MRAVLGIDAAWTSTQPSGVALVVGSVGNWSLLRVASSYQAFYCTDATDRIPQRPAEGAADVRRLLDTANSLAGYTLDLIAIDMPLSLAPVRGRRTSDNLVSTEYGARQCATHSPTAARPGALSENLRRSFCEAGYHLKTDNIGAGGLIEVYPHPALVELTNAPRRLPYKAGKVRKYWPSALPEKRKARVLWIWSEIVRRLEDEIDGVRDLMPPVPEVNAAGWIFKAYEDALDAVVCAWVGICALDARAVPFGDEHSAIWIPQSRAAWRADEKDELLDNGLAGR